ncbi:MAG: glycosyltransferase family 39 protein [bacterium]|nr:glycosyltransferase family 39 protein [bacterium]
MRTRTNILHSRLTLALMVVVLLVAALMRVYHLTLQSLWFDEAFAWNIIIQPDMFPRIAADTHPPLYYLLLRGWTALAGDSPLALRYLSTLTSILTVALVYQIGAELIRRRDHLFYTAVPVAGALLLALTDMEVDLAQEARNYALYTCLACLSMALYLRWERRDQNTLLSPLFVSWIVANTALVYTHYQGAFIPGVQGLHVLLFLRGRKRIEGIAGLAVSGLLLTPWMLLVTIPQAERAISEGIPFSIPSNLETLLHLRREFLGQMWPLLLVLLITGMFTVNGSRISQANVSIPILLTISPGKQGKNREAFKVPLPKGEGFRVRAQDQVRDSSVVTRRTQHGSVFLLVAWLVLPFAVLYIGNLYAPLLTERKLAIITPALALLAAFGLANVRQPAAGLLLLALVIYGAAYVDSYRLKEPWDDLAAEAVRYAEPGDLALIEMGNGQYPMKYYWSHQMPDGVTLSTFPVLGDPTMAPTTDWYTYYDGLLPQQIDSALAQNSNGVTTAWVGFWSKETTSLARLEQAGFTRTMVVSYDHLGNALNLYRYDHLPENDATRFESGMRLRAVEIDEAALRVDLWWSTDVPLTGEYVTSVLLLDENGTLAAQLDSVPFQGQRSTLTWQPGEVMFDPKPLQLANGWTQLPPGNYRVVVQVYSFDASGQLVKSNTSDGAEWYEAGTISR